MDLYPGSNDTNFNILKLINKVLKVYLIVKIYGNQIRVGYDKSYEGNIFEIPEYRLLPVGLKFFCFNFLLTPLSYKYSKLISHINMLLTWPRATLSRSIYRHLVVFSTMANFICSSSTLVILNQND